MSYVYRYDLINQLIKKFGFKNYLEIGVSDPSECFDNVVCENKMGVDPGLEFPDNPVKYPMTSDVFFSSLERGDLDLDPGFRWDVIFIDGLHISTQVMKDVINSLYHLNPLLSHQHSTITSLQHILQPIQHLTTLPAHTLSLLHQLLGRHSSASAYLPLSQKEAAHAGHPPFLTQTPMTPSPPCHRHSSLSPWDPMTASA